MASYYSQCAIARRPGRLYRMRNAYHCWRLINAKGYRQSSGECEVSMKLGPNCLPSGRHTA